MSLIGNLTDAVSNIITDVVSGLDSTVHVTLDNVVGNFQVDEQVQHNLSIGRVTSYDRNSLTMNIKTEVGTFEKGNIIIGLTSLAVGTITGTGSANPFDFLNLFPNGTPDNFSFSDYILSVPSAANLTPVDSIMKISDAISGTAEVDLVYREAVVKVTNPANVFAVSVPSQTDRHVQTHGTEPAFQFKGQYPYNKSNRTESGHLLEIDDTPGAERILQHHKSGTYEEIHHDGQRVMKIVGKNNHITLQDENIFVEGEAVVNIKGNVTLRIGGTLTIQAEKGMHLISPADIRMKANNIVMEATNGNVDMLANKDIRATAKGNTNITSINNLLTASANTEISSGADLNLLSKNNYFSSGSNTEIFTGGNLDQYGTAGVSINSAKDMNILSQTDFKLNSAAKINISASGNFNADAAQIHFQEGAATAPTMPSVTTAIVTTANPTLGTGITFSAIVEHMFTESDDDPEAFAKATQDAINAGLIDKDALNRKPTVTGSPDTTAAGNVKIDYKDAPVAKLSSFPVNLQLSPHFTLGKLTVQTPAGSHLLKAQYGYTEAQLAGNLQLLALNVLEKIYAKYSDMTVTSSFRTGNTTGNKVSQHCKGMAADIQFASAQQNKQLYLQYAQWIRDNCVFDQLLLEHNNFGNKPYWIHLSFDPSKTKQRGEIMTLFNNKTYSQGLVFLQDS
jgi:hypothetical protein